MGTSRIASGKSFYICKYLFTFFFFCKIDGNFGIPDAGSSLSDPRTWQLLILNVSFSSMKCLKSSEAVAEFSLHW